MLPNKRAWKWKRGTCSTSTSIPIAIRNLGLNLAVREPVLYSDVPVSFACVFFSCILHVQVLAMHPIRQKYNRRDLPESFDGRVQWRGLLQPVRDQGW